MLAGMNFYLKSIHLHFPRLPLVVTLTVALFLLIFGFEEAQGSYVIPAKGIDFAEGHDTPEGVWSDGTTVWVMANGQDKVLAYSLANRNRRPGKDIELASYNSKPRGIWSDGTTMWVSGMTPNCLSPEWTGRQRTST